MSASRQDGGPNGAAPQGRLPFGLADRLRERTWELHGQAERAGIMRALLAGTVCRESYALLLRNLQPVYATLEGELQRRADLPVVGPLACPAVYRSSALASDLVRLAGARWRSRLPRLGASRRYCRAIEQAGATGDGARLIGHAYVRYLGDLSGGQLLAGLVERSLGLGAESLSFYAFGSPEATRALRRSYRARIDHALHASGAFDAVADEAAAAFAANIALFEAVATRAAPGVAPGDGASPG